MTHNVLVLGTVLGCLFLVFVVQHSGSPRAGSSSEAGEVAVLREKLAVAEQTVEVLEAAAARQTKLLGDKFGKDLLSGAHNAARTEHKLKMYGPGIGALCAACAPRMCARADGMCCRYNRVPPFCHLLHPAALTAA